MYKIYSRDRLLLASPKTTRGWGGEKKDLVPVSKKKTFITL